MANNAELSEPMLEAMRVIAQQAGKDLNSILNEAAEQYIARKEMHELMAYGKENASRLGRVPSDAVKFVREDRNNQSRGR
jgi:regulator of protease activity HflC (stomatin/prohibitin superfamily)